MSLHSIVQIIKVNEKRNGIKDGRAWELQDPECLLLDDAGNPQQVGVLSLPKHLRGDDAPKPGVYLGSFALQAAIRDRRIEALLTALQPHPGFNKPTPKAQA